ncbi:hypothetical protein [Gordonia otitidis]|uniref:CYTH domain-containing protein n=1 Tax=Gordonia otitidis (strain DSM 44809 / CCUG 52243 / JCM 12355 / NBRC 100426 / IFM 10032) TaxID=1108044 RepID=H5TJN5_GORO1|nr:hypothetical protein [Gordonia otitidis]GAB33693.1 hypothetical protein GOOTI_077_00140 [Gordonia otitidis NBRC 100426]
MIVPISITLNIDTGIDDIVDALDCRIDNATQRRFWFAEAHHASADTPTPLYDSRVVIRLRSGARDDLTVTMLPESCDRLTGDWAAPFDRDDLEYRISERWCGGSRQLTASARTHHPAGAMVAAIRDGADPTHLLDMSQRRFLVACATSGTPIDHLVIRGPITSHVWDTALPENRRVRVERWLTDGLDVLGITTRVELRPGDASYDLTARAVDAAGELRDGLSGLGGQTSPLASRTALALRVLSGAAT